MLLLLLGAGLREGGAAKLKGCCGACCCSAFAACALRPPVVEEEEAEEEEVGVVETGKPVTTAAGLLLALKPSVWRSGTGMEEEELCAACCCCLLRGNACPLSSPPVTELLASLPGGEELQVPKPTLLPRDLLVLLDRLNTRASEGEATQLCSGGVGVGLELGGVEDRGMLRAREGCCLPSGRAGVGRSAAMHSRPV